MVEKKPEKVLGIDVKNRPAGMVKKLDVRPKLIVKKIVKKESHDEKVSRSLRASVNEGTLNASSSSIINTFVTPLALELKATNAEIGMLSAVQDFASTVAQIPGAKMTEYYPRKSIWLLSQIMGRIIFILPIVLLPFLTLDHPVAVLIILMGLVSFFLGLRSPAWSSLMGDLVPLKVRGKYFGLRNAITGIAGVATTIAAGLLLTYYGFSFIFVIAIAMGAVSIIFFMRMYEPSFRKVFHYKHSFGFNPRGWGTSISVNKALAIFTLYLFFMNFAVEVASPFYSVYMIRDLHIDYAWYALLITLGAVARIASFRYWGRLNDRFGSRKILVVTGFSACFTPFFWLFASSIPEVALVRIFDGFIWAGLDQVVFNYLLDITPTSKRPQYVANSNFFSGWGTILGAIAGGFMAQAFEGSSFGLFHGLQILFLVSFVLRVLVLTILVKIREIDVRNSLLVPLRYVFWQSVAVEPAHGMKNTIFYTFRYPEKFKKDLEGSVTKMKYRIRVRKVS